MKIRVLTLYPKKFNGVFAQSIIKRAQDKKIISIDIINIRDFTQNSYKTVDDKPYGGGQGMILKFDVLLKSLESDQSNSYKILLSPSGKKYTQETALKYSQKKNITLICASFEGYDARIEKYVDEVISIGDYVLTSGEIAAMVIIDSTVRLIPKVIKIGSLITESFNQHLLEYPQYTRPKEFKGQKVPQVLLSGNHQKINKWRQLETKKRTKKFRPDL